MVTVHCFFLEIYTKNNVGLRPKNDNDLQPKKIPFFGWLYGLTRYPWVGGTHDINLQFVAS